MKNSFILHLIILLVPLEVCAHAMHAQLPAGWYPQEETKLKNRLAFLEKEAELKYRSTVTKPRALIVPHAGYSYSGVVAASCFNTLKNSTTTVDRIIVIAPSHAVPFNGIAVPTQTQKYVIATGNIPFDTKSIKSLSKQHPFISSQKLFNDPFKNEHSFEIECPFIYKYLGDNIPVIPLLVGYLTDKEIKACASILKKYISKNTLIIVSSDFIHYGPQFDYMPFGPTLEAARAIQALDFTIMQYLFDPSLTDFLRILKQTKATICGKYPLAILLALLENNALGTVQPHLIAYSNSQENSQEATESSVSYAAIAYSQDASLTNYEKKLLHLYAKHVLKNSFLADEEKTQFPLVIAPCMKQLCGTFVKWKNPDHSLRGCIGTVHADDSLINNISKYSLLAAFNDSRFTPITAEELEYVAPTITVLTPFKKIKSYTDIILGFNGIILKNGSKQAVFLPQVAIEQQWDLPTTLEQLSLKAGLDKDAWKNKETTFEVCEGYEIN